MYVRYLTVLYLQKASQTYRGKNKAGKLIEKGIAFPVCVSVNECVCHCSPLASDDTVSHSTSCCSRSCSCSHSLLFISPLPLLLLLLFFLLFFSFFLMLHHTSACYSLFFYPIYFSHLSSSPNLIHDTILTFSNHYSYTNFHSTPLPLIFLSSYFFPLSLFQSLSTSSTILPSRTPKLIPFNHFSSYTVRTS